MKNLFNKVKQFFKRNKIISFVIELFKLDGNSYMPSSLSFYLILSLVPLISIIFMILSFYSKNSVDMVIDFLSELQLFNDDTVKELVHYFSNIKVSDYITLVISIIASIYVASRGIECFSRFSDRFYGRETLDKHFFKRKIRSIFITLVMIIGVSASVIIMAGFETMTKSFLSKEVSTWLKYPLILVVLNIFILFLFKLSPTQKVSFKEILPGSYICSILLTVGLLGYGLYLRYNVNHLQSIYGPLTSIILLLLLAYAMSYIVFITFYSNILIKKYRDSINDEKFITLNNSGQKIGKSPVFISHEEVLKQKNKSKSNSKKNKK